MTSTFANPISYKRIADAISYYEGCGYEYVELPWQVPKWAINITSPGGLVMSDECGALVGSAEQSFLWAERSHLLVPGRYVACTPCFRMGDNDGALHQSTFMKVELFRTDKADKDVVDEMIFEAMEFAAQQLRERTEWITQPMRTMPDTNRSEEAYSTDILLNGIEIGSYGTRKHGDMEWAFGTGVAEPRFTMASNAPMPFYIDSESIHQEASAIHKPKDTGGVALQGPRG